VAITRDSHGLSSDHTGIGLRLPHLAEVVATRPSVGWFEIHPENFLPNPHATELLLDITREYPVAIHTVGVSVGSAHGLEIDHLERFAKFVERLNPCLVSGHLAWSTAHGQYLNDLLPLPYTEETLRLVADQLARVENKLGRRYLLENPSSYVGFAHSTMTEVEFLGELVSRTGCHLLCDVSNVFVSGHNMGHDPYEYIDRLPSSAVRELHLGGFTREDDEVTPGHAVLIDTHAHRIDDAVWPLYAHALRRFGDAPTLIEWDNDIPTLAQLIGEAERTDRVRSQSLEVIRAAR
jgi:uncharacterized protein (UPF0276 family)